MRRRRVGKKSYWDIGHVPAYPQVHGPVEQFEKGVHAARQVPEPLNSNHFPHPPKG